MSHPRGRRAAADPADPADPGSAGGAGADGRRPLAGRLTPRRLALVAGGLVALLVVLGALSQRDDATPAAGPTPSASSSPDPSPGPDGTESAVPPVEPGAEPEPAPEGEPAPADPALPELPAPLTPRALTEEVEIGPEAVARVSRLESVQGEPQGVGEIAGPALRFTVEVENTGTEPIPIQDAVINVTYGSEATPATEVSGPGRQPFAGQIAPGASATGTFVFLVPSEERGAVSISLEYRAGAPIAVFAGSASAAPAG